MKIKNALFLLHFLALSYVYADLVEESEVTTDRYSDSDSDEQPQNSEEINDNVVENDVENELVEDVKSTDAPLIAEEHVSEDNDQLRLFVIDQNNQSSTNPNSNTLESERDGDETLDNLPPMQEEVEQSPAERSENDAAEKNIVEYQLPDPKDVKDQNTNIDINQQLATGKYIKDAIELQNVVIQVLDKKSAQCELKKIELNKPVIIGKFNDLSIVLKKAFMTPENVVPFSVIGYVEIHDPRDKDNKVLFANWLCSEFTSGITFDHALYDIKMTNEKDI